MKLIKLPDIGFAPYNIKITYDYTDVAALATDTAATQVLPFTTGSLAVGTAILSAALLVTTAFDASDAAINSLLAEVGDDGDPNRIIGQVQTAVDGTEVLYTIAAPNYVYTAANALDLTLTAAGGASPLLSEVTSGEAEIYLQVFDLNELTIVT